MVPFRKFITKVLRPEPFERKPGVEGPSITVVVPLYNHRRYIETTLDSIVGQTRSADEIILIDDGSTDDGFEIAKHKLRDARNAFLFKQSNKGAHVTLNTAIGMARGRYIAILNSDDLFLPEKLERCLELARKTPDVLLVAGGVRLIDDQGARLQSGGHFEWLAQAKQFYRDTSLRELSLLNDNYVCTTSNMFFRRDLWRQVGGLQALRYCHDLDFLLAACKNGRVIFDDDVEHIAYRVHATNTIKENRNKVLVELAAVQAWALSDFGPRIITRDDGELDVSAFKSFLDDKRMEGLICYFQMIAKSFPSRAAFYAHAVSPEQQSNFERFLR